MKREELNDFIRQEVTNAAFDALRNNQSKPESKYLSTAPTSKPKELSEKEIDVFMFGAPKKKRNMRLKKKKKASTLMEAHERAPQILPTEVNAFQDEFEKLVAEIPNASVSFDRQSRDPKGRNLVLIRRPDGIDAIASGAITVGKQGTIKWNFSLFGGFQIETSGKFDMEKETQYLFDNLYTFYSKWQSEWRDKVTSSPDEMSSETEIGDETVSDETAPAPESPPSEEPVA